MKHFKRLNMYKASSVTFNPETEEAYSYNWWCFVKRINGKIVFNNYRYSPSTGKHQSKVSSLLDELGIKVDLFVECPIGLQSNGASQSVDEHYSEMIKELKDAMARPRSQQRKNEERKIVIRQLAKTCAAFKTLICEEV